jgi:hypothetical protein
MRRVAEICGDSTIMTALDHLESELQSRCELKRSDSRASHITAMRDCANRR